MGERVGGFEGAEDAFALRQGFERRQRLLIGRAEIFGAAAVLQMRVLRPDSRIIETGRDGPGIGHLSVLVLQEIGLGAVQDAWPPAKQRRTVLVAGEALPVRLDAAQPSV